MDAAYSAKLNSIETPLTTFEPPGADQSESSDQSADAAQSSNQTVIPLPKTQRRRSKAHLTFVASQPCLVCQRTPSDAHHLVFAQPRAMGRKVSDEFTVPLCREHHLELHAQGNELSWWANQGIAPLQRAHELWVETLSAQGQRDPFTPPSLP